MQPEFIGISSYYCGVMKFVLKVHILHFSQVRPAGGGQVMQVAQVTPQGTIVTQGLQLPPTARLMTPQMATQQIIGRLPLKPGQTITAGKPGPSTVTLPIQVAVPAQGTLPTFASLPQTIIQASSLAATPITGPMVVTSLGQVDTSRSTTGTVTVMTSGAPTNATDFGTIQTVQITPTKSPVVGAPPGSPAASASTIGSNAASPAGTPVQTPVKSDAATNPQTTTVTVASTAAGPAAAKKEVTKLITISATDNKKAIIFKQKLKVDVKPKSPAKAEKSESVQKPQETRKPEEESKKEAKEEKDGEKKEEKMVESTDKPDDTFNAADAMEWEGGIGHLPGSDLKVT